MIKKTGRAVIIIDGNLITIKRTKYKDGKVVKEYYTLPGGHLEENENFEEATIRELEEELGVKTKITKEIFSYYNEDLKQEEKFFECEIISGILGTGTGEEWQDHDREKYGDFELVNIKLEEIENYNLLPIEMKKIITKLYK